MPSVIPDHLLGVMVGLAWSRPTGCFAEVGVYQGGSAKYLNDVAKMQGRELYLYDTFAGMPFMGEYDQHPVGMFSECSEEEVKALVPEARVIRGVFPESAVEMPPVAFVHADADQYQSTIDVCKHFGPLMVEGGMILFDDYYCVPSCIKAVDECFPDRKVLPDGRAVVVF